MYQENIAAGNGFFFPRQHFLSAIDAANLFFSGFLSGQILLSNVYTVTRSPIYFILLLSIAIHAIVIFAWVQTKNGLFVSEPANPSTQQNITLIPVLLKAASVQKININKKTANKPVKKETAQQNPLQRPGIKILTVKKTVQHKQHVKQKKQIPQTQKNKPVKTTAARTSVKITTTTNKPQQPAPEKTVANRQQIQRHIRKQINLKLAFSRYYPAIAVRNQWQGTVSLGIHVHANGQLSQVRVLNSSGYRILDQAAVSGIMKINILPDTRTLLNGNNFDVILPVIYQLADG